MLIEQVDELFLNYRQNVARCEFLVLDISRMERDLAKKKDNIVESTVSISAVITGMPHGSTTGDPTGRLGTSIADGYVPEDIRELEQELSRRKEELSRKQHDISVVDSLMKCLTEKERYIISNKVIGGLSWNEMRFAYNKHFGTMYTREALKYAKKVAMERVYEAAK